jgi:hypothetical protein
MQLAGRRAAGSRLRELRCAHRVLDLGKGDNASTSNHPEWDMGDQQED